MHRYFNLLRNISNWWTYFLDKFGGLQTDPLFFQTRSGVKIEVPRRLLQTFKEIFFTECYMEGMEYRNLTSPTILDVGANAGYFSLFAASRFPNARIFSFEPIPVNYRMLEQNRNLNPQCNIKTCPVAVAGRSGEIKLSLDPNDSFTTSATIYKSNDSRNQELSVPCISIADIFEENGIERCDLLKMDCEGAEYDIFYSCIDTIFTRINQIAMEVHNGTEPSCNIEAMEAFLQGKGYSTRQRPVGMLWAWRIET
jgi:FkbM family methyltransferase